MKGLGIAGAVTGGAALVAPKFRDLDELSSSGSSLTKRAWYVKETDYLKPTVEMDWTIRKRYDGRLQGQNARTMALYYGKARVLDRTNKQNAVLKQRLMNNDPGWGLKWRNLQDSYKRTYSWTAGFEKPVGGFSNTLAFTATPDERGVPKWTGTPEEASNMLRAAMRLYGSALVGFAHLDSTWRDKVVMEYAAATGAIETAGWVDETPWPPPDTLCPHIVYENVDQGYSTTTKWVIPQKDLWVMSTVSPEPRQNDKTARSTISKTNLFGKLFSNSVYYCTWNFIHGLGYQMLGKLGDQSDPINAGASTVLTGISETSRQNNWTLAPEYGAYIQPNTFMTDLPQAPTKPIDAGMWKFCHTCGKCATVCPSMSISTDKQPSWDLPAVAGKPNIEHGVGPKQFWWDGAGCCLWTAENGGSGTCSLCAANCVFSVDQAALVHSLVKPTIATTSIFNGFLTKMSESFGYSNFSNPDDWWNMSLPVLGCDTTMVANDKGYRNKV